ncbi:hypothetical protein VIAE108258_21365 [Vibrio aerogenes]
MAQCPADGPANHFHTITNAGNNPNHIQETFKPVRFRVFSLISFVTPVADIVDIFGLTDIRDHADNDFCCQLGSHTEHGGFSSFTGQAGEHFIGGDAHGNRAFLHLLVDFPVAVVGRFILVRNIGKRAAIHIDIIIGTAVCVIGQIPPFMQLAEQREIFPHQGGKVRGILQNRVIFSHTRQFEFIATFFEHQLISATAHVFYMNHAVFIGGAFNFRTITVNHSDRRFWHASAIFVDNADKCLAAANHTTTIQYFVGREVGFSGLNTGEQIGFFLLAGFF